MHIGRLSFASARHASSSRTCPSSGMTPQSTAHSSSQAHRVSLPGQRCSSARCCFDVDRDDRLGDAASRRCRTARHSFPKFTRDSGQPPPKRVRRRRWSTCGLARQFTFEDHGDAVEHGRAQSRRHRGRQATDYAAQAQLLERHGRNPELRADAGRHATACSHRRRPVVLRPHRSGHRRRASDSRPATWSSRDWPEQTYHVKSAMRLPADARDLLRAGRSRVAGDRRLHRHLPPVQGRTRAEGPTSASSRDGRRQRVSISGNLRARCSGCPTGSRSPTRRRGSTAARAVQLPDGAARRARTPAHATFDATTRTSISRRSPTSLELKASVSPAARRAEPPRVAARPVRDRHRGDGESRVDAAAGRRADARRACRSSAIEARRSGSASCGARSTTRSAAEPCRSRRRLHLPLRSRRGSTSAPSRFATPTHVRGVRGAHRVGRRLAHPVSRDERRLAGERSPARRHDDRVRLVRPTRFRSAAAASSTA